MVEVEKENTPSHAFRFRDHPYIHEQGFRYTLISIKFGLEVWWRWRFWGGLVEEVGGRETQIYIIFNTRGNDLQEGVMEILGEAVGEEITIT